MNRSENDFRTANLTLASYLSHLDWGYTLVRGEGESAAWVFDGEHIKAHADKFTSGKAQVEPQAFHHSITKTRKTLFDFLKGDDKEWNAERIKENQG